MKYQSVIKSLCCVGFVLTVSACAAPPPYVLVEGEFQRDSQGFLKGISDPKEVKICYSKNGTTANEVTALAQKECARHSRKAIFRGQSYQTCPLVTPIAATYGCVENTTRSNSLPLTRLF